jgi:mannose-6-phosphate isomerase-like protein (cupin superfamily)
MKIIDVDRIAGRQIAIPGMTRTIKDILATERMTTHLGVVPPGQSTSEHVHPGSEEIVFVVQGEGRASAGEQTGDFKANHLLCIPEGVAHYYTNTGAGELILFVVYSPPAEVPKQ